MPTYDEEEIVNEEEVREDIHKLEEDYDTPFSPPDDTGSTLSPTHQKTDPQSDIDSHELYDEGVAGAMEVDPEKQGPIVKNDDPVDDEGEPDLQNA